MSEDFDELLRTVANLVYDRVKHQSFRDRIFEKEMSEELTERRISHEAHKKVFDERKGKYKFIDLWFPEHRTFVKIKTRKYITRTEINELKDEEIVTGLTGVIINFFNGVTFRHTNSGGGARSNDYDPMSSVSMPLEHSRAKSRMTLPQLSGSTGRLSDLNNDHNFRSSTKLPYRTPLSVLPLSADKDSYGNANKIFSLSCAAFFLSEGNRAQFSTIFNDLLESMKFDKISIPKKFLEGPDLKTPDGELAGVLEKALRQRRPSTKKDTSTSSTYRSSAGTDEREGEEVEEEEQQPDVHYVGFDDAAEK